MVEKGGPKGEPVTTAMSIERAFSHEFDELKKKLPTCLSALLRYQPATILTFWSLISGVEPTLSNNLQEIG